MQGRVSRQMRERTEVLVSGIVSMLQPSLCYPSKDIDFTKNYADTRREKRSGC